MLEVVADGVDIITDRLVLRPLNEEFLQSSIKGSLKSAERILGCTISPEWLQSGSVLSLRLDQIFRQPELKPWLLRAICHRKCPIMVGHIGFHTGPNPEYLENWLPGAIEFGFTIFQEFRRQGFAYEAATGLMTWAIERHQIRKFVLTVAPDNVASLALADKLGFKTIGEYLDPEDGVELVMGLSR